MDSSTTGKSDFQSLIDAENANFVATTTILGKTVESVQDFQDLYQSLADFIRISGNGITPEQKKVAFCTLHLLMKCRGDLLLGGLNLVRGYQGDSLRFLRAAIEACAFAAKIKRHPPFADVWLNAVDSDTDYKTFKEKFKRLFPPDDAGLQELRECYDHCSQMIHNSVYAMSGHFSHRRDGTSQHVRFNVFDLPDGPLVGAALYFTLDAHKRILKKFAEVLAGNIRVDRQVWAIRYNSVEAKLDVHRERWKAVIPDPRRTVGGTDETS